MAMSTERLNRQLARSISARHATAMVNTLLNAGHDPARLACRVRLSRPDLRLLANSATIHTTTRIDLLLSALLEHLGLSCPLGEPFRRSA